MFDGKLVCPTAPTAAHILARIPKVLVAARSVELKKEEKYGNHFHCFSPCYNNFPVPEENALRLLEEPTIISIFILLFQC